MKFYLDEDLSPKIAAILRRGGVDALSAHEVDMCEMPDQKLLEFAPREKRCLVTRNRDDFIKITLQFFNSHLPHCGVLIIPHTIPGDQFSRIANLIKKFSSPYPEGLEPYSVMFLPTT
jgi:predicted nuclease of predicted toxin-antitoxin system